MRQMLFATIAAASMLASAPAFAQSSNTLAGAAIGAGTGAIVLGPIGAVAGGVIGAVVGAPIKHRHARRAQVHRAYVQRAAPRCTFDADGYRRCKG
jgi:outer membrane lipoprotein SlyB